MRITLRSGGIIRSGPERELIDDYLKRANGLTRNTGFQSVSEDQIDLKKEKSRAEETHKLLPDLPASTCRVILDERGKSVSSRDIAKYLARARDDGYSECVFVIGGADGFEPAGIPAGTPKMVLWRADLAPQTRSCHAGRAGLPRAVNSCRLPLSPGLTYR